MKKKNTIRDFPFPQDAAITIENQPAARVRARVTESKTSASKRNLNGQRAAGDRSTSTTTGAPLGDSPKDARELERDQADGRLHGQVIRKRSPFFSSPSSRRVHSGP